MDFQYWTGEEVVCNYKGERVSGTIVGEEKGLYEVKLAGGISIHRLPRHIANDRKWLFDELKELFASDKSSPCGVSNGAVYVLQKCGALKDLYAPIDASKEGYYKAFSHLESVKQLVLGRDLTGANYSRSVNDICTWANPTYAIWKDAVDTSKNRYGQNVPMVFELDITKLAHTIEYVAGNVDALN